MRAIKYIVVHCSATDPETSVISIERFWREKLGWKNPGYHFLIEYNGRIHKLLPIEKVANGVKGHNYNSIHVSYIGGIDTNGKAKDTRSLAQKSAMVEVLRDLKRQFPDAVILGHRDFPGVAKDCPSFDVSAWIKTVNF